MDLPKVQWYKMLFCCVFGDSDSKVQDNSHYQTIFQGDREAGSDATALVSNDAEKMQKKKKKKKKKKKGKKCEHSDGAISRSVVDSLEDFMKESDTESVGAPLRDSVIKPDQDSVGEVLTGESDVSVTFTSPEVSEGTKPTFSSEFAMKVGTNSRTSWWVDSGASQHMSWDRKEFVDYISFDNPVKVNLADNTYLLARGSGQIKLRLYDGNQCVGVILNNVLYVPKIQNKLFSVSSAADEGAGLTFDKGGVILKKDGKSKKIGLKKGKLFHLSCEPENREESCCLAKQENISLGDTKLIFRFTG